MTIATNSAGTRQEQLLMKRFQVEDLRSQAQHALNLAMAANRLLAAPTRNDSDDRRCIDSAEAVTQATWSELGTLIDMFDDYVGPKGDWQ